MSSAKLDTMYNFVESKLKTVTSTLDLIPFINSLMSLKTLKIQLSMALHQVYIQSKTQSTNRRKSKPQSNPNYMRIQSLFFQLQRFNNVKNELSLKSSRIIINKLKTSPSQQHLPSPIVDKNCASPTSCIAVDRVTKALLHYETLLSEDKNGNIKDIRFPESIYKHLLNDYHHILNHHHTTDAFGSIYAQMIKHLQLCDITTCMKFRRNRRIRENETIKILKCDSDENYNFYVDLLDSIHCYFFHSFDIGMRIKAHELISNEKESKQLQKKKKIKVDNDEFYADKKLSKLKTILNKKLFPLKRHYVIKGGQNKYFANLNDETPTLPRTLAPVYKNVFNHNKQEKFENIITELMPHLKTSVVDIIKWLMGYIKEEEFEDQEAIRLDLDDEEYSAIRNSIQSHFELSDDVMVLIHHILRRDIFNDDGNGDNRKHSDARGHSKSTFSTSTSYDFGHKFYYWDEYKENNQYDYGPNIGYKKKDWYIMKKYNNLKDEIVNNQICELEMAQYKQIIKKAEMNIKSELCKSNKSADSLSAEYYKTKCNSPLNIQNVMSLVLYSDFVDLVFHFRRTFRPISDQETNEQLKNRHREYWNWSKLLSETVELFGDSISNCSVNVFYYGVSFLLSFPNFISHFCGPTSATKYLEVSTIFSDDNGMILELVAENDYSNLKCMNLTWISSYAQEAEYLFFGGYRPLKFKSIRLMKPAQDYTLFIKALTLFNHVVKAKALSVEVIRSITKIDYKIIKSLMRHYMGNVEYRNNSPNYINNLFKSFCGSKKYIHINIARMNKHYPGFKKYLMIPLQTRSDIDVQYDNMLSMEIIAALFPFCEELIVWETGIMTKHYVSILIEQLKILNTQHRSMLKTIKLCDVRYNNELLNKAFEKEFGELFQSAFCRVHVDVKVRLQHENQHSNLFKEIPEVSHLIITRKYRKYKASVKRNLVIGIDISNDSKYRNKSKRWKNKRRSRSYHRRKYTQNRNHSLRPLYVSSRKLTAV